MAETPELFEAPPGAPKQEPGPAPVAPEAPDVGTGLTKVADRPEEVSARDRIIGDLPPQYRAQYRLQQLEREVQSSIASASWGKKLDVRTRQAIAQWCAKYTVDVTEIDVLGGNIYRNARFYLSRLAKLAQAGLVEYAFAEHIHNDPRLLSAVLEVADEQTRKQLRAAYDHRLKLRADYNVSEDAIAAVIYHVKLKGMAREVVGVKQVFNDPTRDPVGTSKPAETAETRAARRCLRQLIPNLVGPEGATAGAMEAEWEKLEKQAEAVLAVKPDEPKYVPVKDNGYDAEAK